MATTARSRSHAIRSRADVTRAGRSRSAASPCRVSRKPKSCARCSSAGKSSPSKRRRDVINFTLWDREDALSDELRKLVGSKVLLDLWTQYPLGSNDHFAGDLGVAFSIACSAVSNL